MAANTEWTPLWGRSEGWSVRWVEHSEGQRTVLRTPSYQHVVLHQQEVASP